MSNSAGKGDKWRKTDFKKYFENFDEIKKSEKSNLVEVKRVKGKVTYVYKRD